MSRERILHIGIAPREAIKRWTIAVAKGETRPGPDDPRVWFTSMESLAKVLSEKNMLLLEIIRNSNPQSVTELARLAGRAKSNLSRTLNNMERLGLIEMKSVDHRKIPTVTYDRIRADFSLDLSPAGKRAA